jgi:hypothetical protein
MVQAGKFGANELKQLLTKFLSSQKEARTGDVRPMGKQSIKELMSQNTGLSNIEITDGNIKDFERTARKYGIDFSLKKDKTVDPPKYIVFFKARDVDVMTTAFESYTKRTMTKAKVKESILEKLAVAKETVKQQKQRVKERVKTREASL